VKLALCETVGHKAIEFALNIVKALYMFDRYALPGVSDLSNPELHPVKILAQLLDVAFVGPMDFFKALGEFLLLPEVDQAGLE
jgi:hypothetical protein